MSVRGRRNVNKVAPIIIAGVTLITYIYIIDGDFVGDDDNVIVKHDIIKTFKNLPVLFSPGKYFVRSGEISYRPIVTFSYFVDYWLWKLNPLGYRLTNILLHISTAISVYFLTAFMFGRKAALVSAILFAVHPVNVEVVAVPSFRDDILCGLFLVLSFLLFLKDKKIASAFFFLIALFSKEMALVLPILIIVHDILVRKKVPPLGKGVGGIKWRRVLRSLDRYIAHLIAILFYVIIRFFIFTGTKTEPLLKEFSVRLLTMFRITVEYLKILIFPINISFWTPDSIPVSHSPFNLPTFLSILTLVICIAGLIALWKRNPHLSFAGLWFFITLAPVSNIFPLPFPMANRFLYIPSIGFCVFIAAIFYEKLRWRLVPRYLLVSFIIYCSYLSVRDGMSYKNNTTFWTRVVSIRKNDPLPLFKLGVEFTLKGKDGIAIMLFHEVIRCDPAYVDAHYYLGRCFMRLNLDNEAIAQFETALRIDPNYKRAQDALRNLRE